MDDVRCSEHVRTDAWSPPHPCTNKAKGERDGSPLCGRHLSVYDRRAQKAAANAQRRAESDKKEAEASSVCNELARVGILATPYYHSLGSPSEWRFTGGVIVDAADIRRLMGK